MRPNHSRATALLAAALAATGAALFLAPAWSQKATLTPDRIRQDELRPPFTLVFDVRKTVLRNAAGDLIAAPVPTNYTLTVSARGSDLFYQSQTGKKIETAIFDGKSTKECWNDSNLATISPGFSPGDFGDMPLPGAGMPSFPIGDLSRVQSVVLARAGNVGANASMPIMGATGPSGVPYAPATVTYTGEPGGGISLTGARVLAQGAVLDAWSFANPFKFGNIWISQRIVHTVYSGPPPPDHVMPSSLAGLRIAPFDIYTYQLKSCSGSPLPAAEFDFRSHLAPWTTINDYRKGDTLGTIQAFQNDPTGGALAQQEAEQRIRDRETASAAASGNVPRRSPGALLLAVAALLVAAALVLWRRLGRVRVN